MSLPTFIKIKRSQIIGHSECCSHVGKILSELKRNSESPAFSKNELSIYAIQHPIVVTPRNKSTRKTKETTNYITICGLNTLSQWLIYDCKNNVESELYVLCLSDPSKDDIMLHAMIEGFLTCFCSQFGKDDFSHIYHEYMNLPEIFRRDNDGAIDEIFSSQRSFIEHAKLTRKTLLNNRKAIKRKINSSTTTNSKHDLSEEFIDAIQNLQQ